MQESEDYRAVTASDFTGEAKAAVAPGSESGVPQDVAERAPAPADGTYELSAVEEQPTLTNAADVARFISRNYPPLLRDAGIMGQALLRFRIQADGRVDALSITVDSSTHDAFGEPAMKVAQRMQYRPAKVAGAAVPVWMTAPILFQLQRNG